MAILADIAKIDSPLRTDTHRRIARARCTAGNMAHRKGEAVVHGDDEALCAPAVLIRNIDDSAAAYLDMTVESSAVRQGVHRMRQFISKSAILAERHFRVAHILRGVVHRMRILREWSSSCELRAGSRRCKQLCSG